MNDKGTRKCLRQADHIRGQLMTQIIRNVQLGHGGERKTLEAKTST